MTATNSSNKSYYANAKDNSDSLPELNINFNDGRFDGDFELGIKPQKIVRSEEKETEKVTKEEVKHANHIYNIDDSSVYHIISYSELKKMVLYLLLK